MTPYHIIKYAMTIDAQQHDIETILSNIKFLNYNGHCPAFQYIGHIETFLSNLDQIDLIAFNKTIKKVIFSTLDGPYFSKTGESYETDESYTVADIFRWITKHYHYLHRNDWIAVQSC